MMPIHAWRPAMLALALPALALTGVAAHAQTADDDAVIRHMPVHYGDLDLTTAKGRHRLEMRLQRSAAMVCGHDDGTRPQLGEDEQRRCYDKALHQAHVALAAMLAPDRMASRQ